MGRRRDRFISVVEAAKLLERSPEEVISLCNEGLIRRHSTGLKVLIHEGDVLEVHETNLHDLARPRDLVKNVLLLQRQVRSLSRMMELYGRVNGLLSCSLDDFSDQELVALNVSVERALLQDEWSLETIQQFAEMFLRISESDFLRLNSALGVHESWRVFYKLCLHMTWFAREGEFPPGRAVDTARCMLQRGLRNLRSVGVLFIENAAFLQTSQDMLKSTMSHDLVEFDSLIKQTKHPKKFDALSNRLQNT